MNDLNGIGNCTGRVTLVQITHIVRLTFISKLPFKNKSQKRIGDQSKDTITVARSFQIVKKRKRMAYKLRAPHANWPHEK